MIFALHSKQREINIKIQLLDKKIEQFRTFHQLQKKLKDVTHYSKVMLEKGRRAML